MNRFSSTDDGLRPTPWRSSASTVATRHRGFPRRSYGPNRGGARSAPWLGRAVGRAHIHGRPMVAGVQVTDTRCQIQWGFNNGVLIAGTTIILRSARHRVCGRLHTARLRSGYRCCTCAEMSARGAWVRSCGTRPTRFSAALHTALLGQRRCGLRMVFTPLLGC